MAPLPTPEAVGRLLTELMGKKVKLAKAPAPLLPTAAAGGAPYLDPEKVLSYAALADAAFIASFGAALAMIPPNVVGDAIRAPKLPETLVENAYEVLNIAASVFNEIEGTALHVKIAKLVLAPLPAEVSTRLGKPTARLDLLACVPGYPDGRLSLLALR